MSFYARVKVLEEKGKELATIELPYLHGDMQITNVSGRTIHADGTVIPLTVKPEDLLLSKSGEHQVNKKVFTLPSAEVGSILEWRYQLRYDDHTYSSPLWEVQRDYFVHRAHYAFTPFKGFLKGSQNVTGRYLVNSRGDTINTLIWSVILPAGDEVKTDATGRLSVDVSDIPPAPHEDWMPPSRSLLYKVQFYYMAAFSGGDFWVTEAKRWSKDVDHFAEDSKPIREAVAGLIAPGDSDLDKAKKLYNAVQALDNTNFSRRKKQSEMKELGLHVAKRAEDTWAQKSGSREDIALLYLAMLRAAGLTAYDMKVVNRNLGVFTPGYLEMSQLDDDVILLSIGGKEIVLDPGEKLCPFQTVSWKHSDAGGIRQTSSGRGAAVTPQQLYTANSLVRHADITVDNHGAMTGNVRLVMYGQEALRWRQTAFETDPEEVKKRFDNWLKSMAPDGVEAHIDHFLGMDDPSVALIAIANVNGTLGAATARRLTLPAFFFEARSSHPFIDQAQRVAPVDMHYGEQVTDEITYHLPPGMSIEGAPQDAKIPWTGHAVFGSRTTSDSGQVNVSRQLARAFTIVKPEEYQDLREFYRKVAAADQQQIVLARAPAAGGN